MVIGVNGVFGANHAAKNFDGLIRDNLIGVHIRLRARPCLPNGEREIIVEFAFCDFGCGLNNRIFGFGVEIVSFEIRAVCAP